MKCTIQIACPKDSNLPTKAAIQKVVASLRPYEKNITIRIVEPTESQLLNKTYRGKDKPTNVLSFPMDFQDYLGDLALCHALIVEEAREQNKPILNHYTHLLIHGVLHLLGYDHETEKDAAIMEKIEIDLLRDLNIPNPYEESTHAA